MQKYKKIMAALLSVAVLVTLLFSLPFIVIETNHNHTGEDCPICLAIETTINTLKALGTAEIISVIFCFVAMRAFCVFSKPYIDMWSQTLVTLKVKMVN